MSDWNTAVIQEFRANGGKVGGAFAGAPLLLLHTVGAKSGQPRVHPLMYQDLGAGRIAIFASYAGMDSNPAWFHNLLADPEVTAEIGTGAVDFRARVAELTEREPIWAKQKTEFPVFAGYEAKTDRVIPVVVLEPR